MRVGVSPANAACRFSGGTKKGDWVGTGVGGHAEAAAVTASVSADWATLAEENEIDAASGARRRTSGTIRRTPL